MSEPIAPPKRQPPPHAGLADETHTPRDDAGDPDDLDAGAGGLKRWLKKLGLYHAALMLVGGTAVLTYYALRTAFGIGPINLGPKLLTPDTWLTSVPIASLINVCVVLVAVGLVRKANSL